MLTKNQNKIFIFSIIIWSLITILKVINRIPDFDEAHAWTIAQQLNLVEIFKLMHIEGHTFIWYLLLMPFAKLNILYPYSMQFLNWLFCLTALIIFWKKAPFNTWIKLLLTFSYPFLFLYSVPARCYSLSILFIFLLAIFYKDKINRPIFYSILLIVSANISAMALIPASVLGLIFIYDIFNLGLNKKDLGLSVCILVVGAFLIGIQNLTFDASLSNMRIGFDTILLKNVLLFKNIYLNSVILFILAGFTIGFLYPFKKPLFFLVNSYLIFLYGISNVYTGYDRHHFFLLIYLLIAFWIVFDNYKEILKFRYFANILLSLLFINFLFTPKPPITKEQTLYKYILKNKEFTNSTIIIPELGSITRGLLPYYIYKDFKLKDYCSDEPLDYKLIRLINSEYCEEKTVDNSFKVFLSTKRLNQLIDSKFTYLFLIDNSGVPFQDFKFDNITFSFKGCIDKSSYCYWKIEK